MCCLRQRSGRVWSCVWEVLGRGALVGLVGMYGARGLWAVRWGSECRSVCRCAEVRVVVVRGGRSWGWGDARTGDEVWRGSFGVDGWRVYAGQERMACGNRVGGTLVVPVQE